MRRRHSYKEKRQVYFSFLSATEFKVAKKKKHSDGETIVVFPQFPVGKEHFNVSSVNMLIPSIY